MDIRFSCPTCGHHMIIDEAGAGMIVDCTECGREVTVPKHVRQPPSPAAKEPSGNPQERERTVALKWTPPPTKTDTEPKR